MFYFLVVAILMAVKWYLIFQPVELLQHHLWKICLSSIGLLFHLCQKSDEHVNGSDFSCSVLFHWPMCLSLCQCSGNISFIKWIAKFSFLFYFLEKTVFLKCLVEIPSISVIFNSKVLLISCVCNESERINHKLREDSCNVT